MQQETLQIDGMTCNHCLMAVKKALAALPLASAEVAIGSAIISFDPDKISLSAIVAAIETAGYRVIQTA
jgi:copper chaperone